MRLRKLAGLVALSSGATLFAHPDDPKLLDREPRYEGPGWRSGLREVPHNFPYSNVELMSWISLPEFGPSSAGGNDCWGYVSPSGREYAIMGLTDGTAWVEITDPSNPQILIKHSGPTSTWHDIKVYQHYAYAVSEGGSGIQIFDMSQIDAGVVTFVRTVTSGGTTATHNVAIDTVSGYLYRCGGGNNGLRIYNLAANPTNPPYVGSWPARYVHDCQAITITSGPNAGKQLVFACSGYNGGRGSTGLEIIDVTNKSNMILLSRTLHDQAAYAHQCWLSTDQRYVFMNDELDEQGYGFTTRTRVFDVTNLSFPEYVGYFSSGSSAIDHNLYVHGTLVTQANYRSGLRVFDVPDPRYAVQIGYFDTYPVSNSDQFNGLWSNYPFFPSGTIIGSDIERGLFVMRLPTVPLTIGFPDGLLETISAAGGDKLKVKIHAYRPGAYDGATPVLHIDYGVGFQAVPMVQLSPDEFEATLPAVRCNAFVDYYVSVESAEGPTITSPFGLAIDPYQAFAEPAEQPMLQDTFESSGGGWTVNASGTDDASAGFWTWGDPVGTAAQPENDVTVGGTRCWFTGQGSPGGNIDAADVETGVTTLTSPSFDLTSYENPVVGYWRWYSNIYGDLPQHDYFRVLISNDAGANWTTVEEFRQGVQAAGGWHYFRFRVADYLAPTSQVRVRFEARDGGGQPTIVEAALDEFTIADLPCPDLCLPQDISGNGVVDLDDLLLLLGNYGATGPELMGDVDANGTVDLDDLLQVLGVFGAVCQ